MNPTRSPKAMKRARLIINPISGTGDKRDLARKVTERLAECGYEVETVNTAGPGDATALAASAVSRGFDAVIAAGGDGTINETARGLCGTAVPLGIIPAGSGNGLARHLEIPIDADKALDIIAKKIIIDGDYGTVNGEPFFCTFGLGYDAAVSHNFAGQGSRGLFTYLKSCMEEIVRYDAETYTVSANGKILTDRAFVVACCNASQYGNNAYIAPEASITDGLLDIIIIHQGSPLDKAIVGLDLITGYINKSTMIQVLRAPSAVIYRKNPGKAHIDGEPCMLGDILEVKCHAHSLRIFAPGDDRPVKPFVTPTASFWKGVWLSVSRWFSSKL